MIYAGVDPGKTGAIAVLDADGGVVQVGPIPILTSTNGRAYYDLPAIRDWMLNLRGRQVFVTVEKLQAMSGPHGGSLANFGRGECQGWNWLLTALWIPYHLVEPKAWQRVMHAGTPGQDTKQRSILAAQRLFPSVSLKRTPGCKTLSDGIAEALLIAEYGRRVR